MSVSLTLNNVSKLFPRRSIIENTTFSFHEGCYCLMGPNGIGKTTILDILAGVQLQDLGDIKLFNGFTLTNTTLEYKKKLCYVPSNSSFFPTATGMEFLNFIMSIKGDDNDQQIHCIEDLVQQFKIDQYLNTKFGEMSLGTQKKFFLVTLIIGRNQLNILDEPTNGLDKESIAVLTTLLDRLRSNTIVIMSTHDQNLISSLKPNIIKLEEAPIRGLAINEENQ